MTDFDALIDEIDSMPFGPDERAALRSAIAQADEEHDLDAAYRLRLRQTTSSFMSGDIETMLSSFPWTVATHDSDPGRFPYQHDRHDLLWQYKWMAEVLLANPSFSLDQSDDVVADMERRYTAAGVGLAGVWQARFSNAFETGHLDRAAEFRRAREATPDDDYSHCDACVRSDDALYFHEIGDDAEALRVFDEIIDGQFSCGEEPERAQGNALLALLRAGRPEDAELHHRRALRYSEVNPDPLPLVSPHLPFLAVTGNHARSLSLIETHLPLWGADSIDSRTRMAVARAFAVALDAAAAAGYGDRLVANSDAPGVAVVLGEHDGLWRVGELAEASWAVADELAAAFDARNGTDRHARTMAAARALADEDHPLPLYSESLVADLPLGNAPSAEEAADRADLFVQLVGDMRAALEVASGALSHAEGETARRLAGTVWQASAALELPTEAAEAHYVAASRAAGRSGDAELVEALSTGLLSPDVDLSGWTSHADPLVRLRATLNEALKDELPDLEPVLALALESGEATRAIADRIQVMLARFHAGTGDPDRARALLQGSLTSSQPWIAYLANWTLSTMAAEAEDHATAIGYLEAAQDVALRYGVRQLVADTSAMIADEAWLAGDATTCIRQQRTALRQAQLAGSSGVPRLQYILGVRLAQLGDFEGALEALQASVRGIDEDDRLDDDEVTMRHLNLAKVAQRFDPPHAYSEFRLAEEFVGENPEVEAAVTREFGAFLLRFEDKESLDLLERAVDAARETGNPLETAAGLHLLGRAKSTFGQGGIKELEEALDLWQQTDFAWEVADVSDSLGRALVGVGRTEDAVAALLLAADGYAATDDVVAAAYSELVAARALLDAGHGAEAVALANAASERATSSGADGFELLHEEAAEIIAKASGEASD